MTKASKIRQFLQHRKAQSQKFIFVREKPTDLNSNQVVELNLSPNKILLSTVSLGNWAVVEEIYTSRDTYHQLRNLGLKSGTAIEVISQTETGSAIVRVNEKQIGLGAEIARRIIVTMAPNN